LFANLFTIRLIKLLGLLGYWVAGGVTAGVTAGVAVTAAPQMALRVVENQFAMAMSGALKMFTELGSALMEDEMSAIFLS
jgi:hypothetical protein